MNFSKLFFIFLIVGFSSTFSSAQEISHNQVKRALNENINPIDSSAGVAYLYYKRRDHFETNGAGGGRELVSDIRVRIKFYDNGSENLNYATHAINLYIGGKNERIQKLEGATYNLVNGKVQKTKMDKNQIFKEDINSNVRQVKFTLPKVKKGSVIEYSYKKVSPYYFYIEDFAFQFDVPAMHIQEQFESPPGFIFNRIPKGRILKKPQHSTLTNPNGFDTDIYTYTLRDVPALKEEPYIDNIENYRSGIVFELMSFRMSDGSTMDFSKTWDDVARTIYFNDDFQKEIGRHGIYSNKIDELTKGLGGEIDKMNAIFTYVKTTFKWDGHYGKSLDKGIRKTFKDKTGDSGDINLLLISMLQYAGVDAKPVFISTKDHMRPFFPTIDKLNFVVALVQDGDKTYFLDATDKYSKPNVMPLCDYNWKGLMVDNLNKKFGLIDLSQPPISKRITLVNAELDAEGNAHGIVKDQRDKHMAYVLRNTLLKEGQESYLRSKESTLENIEISDYQVQNLHEDGKLKQDFSYTYDKASEKIGDKIFFNPMLFFGDTENPFKAKTRYLPIDFGFPFNRKLLANIKIPDGFKVESLPKPLKLYYGNTGSFKYILNKNGNFIRLSMDLEIRYANISYVDYKSLREFFKKLIEKQNEKIVLTKI